MPTRIFAALAVIAAVAATAFWLAAPRAGGPVGLGAAEAQVAGGSDIDMSLYREMSMGDPDAPVTVIEYASFTCPHCATFHSNVLPRLRETYIETGRIHYVTREVYFDPYGLWAGLLARCGDGERYFGIVDLLFSQQREWAASNDGAVVANNLRRLGRIAGFSNDEIDACLENRDLAQALVAAYQQNAGRDNIRGTPSFVINGELHPNMSFADFSRVLDGLLDG